MLTFNTPAAEADFRMRSNDAHNYGRIVRTCCKCGRARHIGELVQANSGPWTRQNPKRFCCRGGCDVSR